MSSSVVSSDAPVRIVKPNDGCVEEDDWEEPKPLQPPRRVGRFQCIASEHENSVPARHRVPYIRTGYRPLLSFTDCLLSLFSIHNQTLNVWTHFLGFLYFLYLLPTTLEETRELEGNTTDMTIRVTYLLTAAACMGFSTLFHLCSAMSDVWFLRFFGLDLLGIALLILGSFVVGTFQSFYCEQRYAVLYSGMVALGAVVSGVLASVDKFRQAQYDNIRQLVFISTVGTALFPVSHWTIHCTRIDWEGPRCSVDYITSCLAMLGLYSVGYIFYRTKFPECFFPGRFDLFLSSHQVWHVFVFLAAFVWQQGNDAFFVLRREVGDEQLCMDRLEAVPGLGILNKPTH